MSVRMPENRSVEGDYMMLDLTGKLKEILKFLGIMGKKITGIKIKP